ncbi:MAG TPA: hypothetical protein VJR29_02725 [bacterium]|nr:hypothetical protein [bacterium]
MSFFFRLWTILLTLSMSLSFSACSKKDGGEVSVPGAESSADSNLGVEGLGTVKISGEPGKDLCSAEGDAYERFAVLTHQPRDYVFQVAQVSGFHAVYQAKPASYTVADLSAIHNYFVQADKLVYGTLNADIENAVIRFGGNVGRYGSDPTDEKWENLDRAYVALVRLLQLRQTLYAAYAAVFGLSGSIAWVPAYDGEIANVTAIKDFLAKLDDASFSTQYHLNHYRKDRIRDAVATIAQGIAVRVGDKDYVLHTGFSVEKKTAVVTLVDIADEAALEFRPTKEEVMTALKDQIAVVVAQAKDFEAQLEVAVANQSAEAAVLREKYKAVQAELSLLQALGYFEAKAVLDANLSTSTTVNQNQQYEAITDLSATYSPPSNGNSYTPVNGFKATYTPGNNSATGYTATYNDDVRLVWTPQYQSAETQPAAPQQ